MIQGKIFFKEEDKEWIEQKVTKLSGVMCAVCQGYLQGKCECTIPQMIGLKKQNIHVVEFIPVECKDYHNDNGCLTNVELHRKEDND
jgi:hypothetical protein